MSALTSQEQCLFQALFFFGGGGFLHPKKTYDSPPQTAAKLFALNLFFGRDMQRITNVSRKLAFNGQQTQTNTSLSNQKGANLCLKRTKIRSQDPIAATGAYF